MGLFDTVLVGCPECGHLTEAQSKSGPCNLDVFTLDEAPIDVMSDVNRHAPFTCGECGATFKVESTVVAQPVLLSKTVKL